MDATISVVCYKSKTLSNGEHPLMLRISKDGKKKYQSLGISVNPKFWDFQKNKPKPKCPNLEYLQKIILDKKLELQKKKLEIKSDQKEYSAATLLEANANLLVAKTVDCFYKEIIAQCEINNKCGNRLVYLNSYNSLKRFTNGKLEIPFNSINVAWLEKYEKWLRSNGNKETTISLMFRTLRSTYNKAIKERCAHLSDYPFQEYKISKFDTSTQKRAIAKTDMLKFTETSQPIGQKKYVELSKDIFIFSYLCGGINFTDIANLTQENIVNGRLHYIRQKTGKLIKIGIPQEAMQIIKKYTDWKIQCKLPPKTKRFCPLKTFNNAPLKSLDRWGYYYFSLFPSVCSHFTDTFSCQLNPVRRMYNTIHNGICYCRVSDCIIPIVRWQLRGDDDGLAPMSVLYYIEQDGSFLGIKVHKEEVIQYEQRAPFDSLEFRFQCAFYFCHLKRTHKFRSIRIICPYALLAGFIPHCCGKEALPGTG